MTRLSYSITPEDGLAEHPRERALIFSPDGCQVQRMPPRQFEAEIKWILGVSQGVMGTYKGRRACKYQNRILVEDPR